MKTGARILFSAVFMAGVAAAQELPADRCVDSEKISDCFMRLNPSKFVEQTVVAQQQAAVAGEPVALPNVSGPGTPSLIDFLNLFAGSISDASFNQADAQYTFE